MNLGMLTVCGAGALGSHLVQFLRSEKLLPIRVVDFDRVESHNLGSQFHGAQGRGKLKVQALQQTMQFLWGAKLVATPTRLTADNVDAVLGGSELVTRDQLVVDQAELFASWTMIGRRTQPPVVSPNPIEKKMMISGIESAPGHRVSATMGSQASACRNAQPIDASFLLLRKRMSGREANWSTAPKNCGTAVSNPMFRSLAPSATSAAER